MYMYICICVSIYTLCIFSYCIYLYSNSICYCNVLVIVYDILKSWAKYKQSSPKQPVEMRWFSCYTSDHLIWTWADHQAVCGNEEFSTDYNLLYRPWSLSLYAETNALTTIAPCSTWQNTDFNLSGGCFPIC